jgi:hypothetical protein
MNKITPEVLAHEAYLYVRQSTADQLLNNPESRRRQYALVARARALGRENAIGIDDDLGRSGDGHVRSGFERLLAAIFSGTAGAVLAIDRSWQGAPIDEPLLLCDAPWRGEGSDAQRRRAPSDRSARASPSSSAWRNKYHFD